MSEIPAELRYAETHEWANEEDEGLLKIGITDHAQTELGELVFVELPEVGDSFSQGDPCAVVESVKAASDVYCPVSGEVVGVNKELADSPELVNHDPYGDGWLFVLKPDDTQELDDLLDAEVYAERLEEDEE